MIDSLANIKKYVTKEKTESGYIFTVNGCEKFIVERDVLRPSLWEVIKDNRILSTHKNLKEVAESVYCHSDFIMSI